MEADFILVSILASYRTMSKTSPSNSKTRPVGIKTLHAALTILKENGGEMRGKDVIAEIGRRVRFDEWESSTYDKTGYVRWQSIFHFYSIGIIKAGYLVKKKGVWYLTPEGEAALSMSPEELVNASTELYRKWREQNPKVEEAESEAESVEAVASNAEFTVEEMQARAREGITTYINAKNPYEFQYLCAALLRGMGYYTPFVAPKGRDGGIDIIAYRDPLGTVAPRIRVQVKHRENVASAEEIRQLLGVTRADSDVGIFISSGGFSGPAQTEARSSRTHIELIDLDRLIDLWHEFYPKLDDEDKNLLPLTPVYFLAPSE
jgi:restriction system protein